MDGWGGLPEKGEELPSERQARRIDWRCSRRSTDRKKCRMGVFRMVPGVKGLGFYSPWSILSSQWDTGPATPARPRLLALGFLGNAPLSSWVFLPVPLASPLLHPQLRFRTNTYITTAFRKLPEKGCEGNNALIFASTCLALAQWARIKPGREVYAIIIPILQKRKLRHTGKRG